MTGLSSGGDYLLSKRLRHGYKSKVFLINLGGGGRSAIQIVSGVDAVTAGGGGGGSDCQKTALCGGGGIARMNCLLCCLLFPS